MPTTGRSVLIFAALLTAPLLLIAQEGDYLSKGNAYYRTGDYASAIKAYSAAVKKGENPAFSWFNLANAHYQNGKPHKAVSCYEMAVLHAPDFARGWINLGVIYHELRDYGACIAALRRAMEIQTADAMTLSLLASAHKELEHYGLAATYLEKALETDSLLTDAFLVLSDIAVMTGDTREALVWLSRYPETGARYYDVVLLSGELLLESGDTAAALATFRKSTALRPSRIQGWISLVQTLNGMGAFYTALVEADRGLENDTASEALALLAGRIAFENGYYRKAERYFGNAFTRGSAAGTVGLGNLLAVYEKFSDTRGINRIRMVLANGSR